MRLACSVGETARLSGQMSMAAYLRDKRGVCKAAAGAASEGNDAGRKQLRCRLASKSTGVLIAGQAALI